MAVWALDSVVQKGTEILPFKVAKYGQERNVKLSKGFGLKPGDGRRV